MKLIRVQRVLAMVLAVLVIAASSQAAVCELACGLEISCHTAAASAAMADSAPMADMMGMSETHCEHGMSLSVAQVSMQACHDGSCSHASIPVLAKAGSMGATQFAAVQWVAVEVVPVQLSLVSRAAGFGLRPPPLAVGIDPLVVSLRV